MKKHNNHRNRGSPEPGGQIETSPQKPKKPLNELQNLLIIIGLSVLPYCSSLYGDFVFDDAESVVNNPIVNGQESLSQIFSRDFWGRPISSPHSHKSYRPVTTFTFWLNYQFGGTSTCGYHTVNIILHGIATVLVYKLAKQFETVFETTGIALPSAVIFAVHPIHTEAVANVTGRAEMLMTTFSLLALLRYLKTKQLDVCYVVLVILSVFSKEQGLMIIPISLSVAMLIKDLTAKKFASFFCLLISLTVLRMWINGFEEARFTKLDNPNSFIESRFYRVVNYTYIWLYHMYLLIYPANLCFDYSMGCISPISSLLDVRVLSPVLICIGVIMGVKFWKECRLSTCLVLFGAFAFLPATNIFFTVGFSVAERVLYLPSVAFCVLCSVVWQKLKKHVKNIDKVAVTLIILAVSKTYQRSGEWKSELSLYSTGLNVCPMNAKIHYNLGKVLGDNGLTKDAEKNYWNAIKLNPSYEQALNNLGNLLEKSGDSRTAESLLTRAVSLKPNFAVAWMNLGISQMNLKKYQDAEKALKNSLILRPHSSHCLFNLGILYQKTNRDLLAMATWRNATIVDPSHSQAWTNLFVVLDHLGHCSEVIHLAPEAISNVPNESRVHMQIGSCYAKEKEYTKAEHHITTAIDLNPTSALYHANLGVLFQRTNRLKEAETQYRIALMMDSRNPIAKENLINLERRYSRNSTNDN